MAPPRNGSIDSAISAMSSGSQPHKNSGDGNQGPIDVAGLIKAAGSPEAVIQYLLKEKQSQSQQNSQLWRLVDKQRAMILGLNKDLERALKDKERYRKKLKEIMASQPVPSLPLSAASKSLDSAGARGAFRGDGTLKEQVLEIPLSPTFDSDSQKHSPVDLAMAPYPITPPADQPNGLPSAVGELLDPSHAMPKSHEHALGQYDHEARDREAEAVRRAADATRDIPLNLALPPSRSLPSRPPQVPPPRLPSAPQAPPPPSSSLFDGSPMDQGLAQFPAPPAPPPRKPPPAPLQLRDPRPSPTIPPEEDAIESDSDYDKLLEVTEITDETKRGRRRTREDDDREREVLAVKEAEARSLSKKSKKSSSAHSTPKEALAPSLNDLPPSPRVLPQSMGMLRRDNVPASLVGVLNGDEAAFASRSILSAGLPSSPRPMGMPLSPLNSPPLSPRPVVVAAGFPSGPLSPRPPRQAIPLPPNTPLQTPSPLNVNGLEPLNLATPKPLKIVKKAPTMEMSESPSPTQGRGESPTERTAIFKGLVTEEYPDLLLPPNALPSVDIKVASSRMKPSRASILSLTQLEEDPVFTLAIFSRVDGGELWRVEKDSASLAKLDQRLKQCSAFTAKTPDRSLFSGHAPAKLDARRQALNHYLDELLNTALDTATAVELCRYLSSNTLPPNADETGGSGAEVVRDTSGPKVGPEGRPLKNGYLTKRGKNFGGWKARFFVLEGPHLRYYETPGGAHLGTIKLQNAQIGKQSPQNDNSSPARPSAGVDDIDNQYRHAFLILEPKKKDPSAVTKHVLCAESDRERDQWVDTLLRWIDYRDPDDEDPKKELDRQDSADVTRGAGGAAAKKKAHGQVRKQPQQQSMDSAETLIGVSYEATQQGEIPQGAPPRMRRVSQDYDMPQTMTSQSPFTISAPRDPQVIADSSAWGGRIGGLAPPTTEEKKARKRSFFGFGTKTRTSSDGQDSLFGDNGGAPGNNNMPAQNPHTPSLRQVFGAPLAEAVRFNSPTDVRVPLPAVVFRCIQYLDAKNAISEEGIFRLSGSNVVIKQLRERFNTESDVDLVNDENYHDIHAVASLLKMYLRELPTTILTRDLHMQFLSVTEIPNQREKLAALNELAQRLPQANATLLKYLIAFLIKIINHSAVNKMTVRNVGIVFSPTLNIPAPVFALLLQNYEAIFGIEPEEYELPSPVMERPQSSRSRRPSVDSVPPRPSTSASQSAQSPHRQRLMESVGGQQRTTPTPPPAMGLAQLNQTRQMAAPIGGPPSSFPMAPPMAPAQRQTMHMQNGYEPSYYAQQQGVGGMSTRPAYESGFVLPPGFDPTQLHTPTGPRGNPGYDRPHYGNPGAPAPYDSSSYPMNGGARRQSAAFTGAPMGAGTQSSRNQLREDSFY